MQKSLDFDTESTRIDEDKYAIEKIKIANDKIDNYLDGLAL